MQKPELISFHWWHCKPTCHGAEDWSNMLAVVHKSMIMWMRSRWISARMPRWKRYLYPDEGQARVRTADTFDNFQIYVHNAWILQRQNRGKISLLVWMETEYLWEKPIVDIVDIIRKYNFDYIVWSVRHIFNIPIDYDKDERQKALEKAWWERGLQVEYYKNLLWVVVWTSPEVIWHFDLINLWSDTGFEPHLDEKISSLVDQIISFVVAYWWVFDVNSKAYEKWLDHPFPSPWIMKKIFAKWWELTFWDDSCWINDIWFWYERALDYIRSFWFSYIVALEKRGGDKGLKKRKIYI